MLKVKITLLLYCIVTISPLFKALCFSKFIDGSCIKIILIGLIHENIFLAIAANLS